MKTCRTIILCAAIAWLFTSNNFAAEEGFTPRQPKVTYSKFSIEFAQRPNAQTGQLEGVGKYSLDEVTCTRFDGVDSTKMQLKVFHNLLDARGELYDTCHEGGCTVPISHKDGGIRNTTLSGGLGTTIELKPGEYYLSTTICYQLDGGQMKLLDTKIKPITIKP